MSPSCVRPETHWVQEEEGQGRSDGRLWFSLQLSLQRAKDLRDAFGSWESRGDFADLIAYGGEMAPASHTALRLAIAADADSKKPEGHAASQAPEPDPMERMLGVDLLVPPQAHDALRRLVVPGTLEITDAGIAVEGALNSREIESTFRPRSVVPDHITPRSKLIIAIIDDGIGLANHRFRATATETRIKHFLDLSLIGTPTTDGTVPELLGRSWTEAEIDALLGQFAEDEERIYHAMGLINPTVARRQPLRMAVCHGTHNLDTAAGYDWRTVSEAPGQRPIIAVQLPPEAAEHRSDTWLPLSLKRALDWILVKADELSADIAGGERLPLIVNCSFASMAGPMDGWSDVERRITQFVRTYRAGGPPELCTVVMSAGNSRQLRAAARIKVQDKPVSVPWRVLPDDRTPSFVQIWLPPQPRDAPQQVRVALRPPGQNNSEMFSVLNRALDWTVGENVRARLYHQSLDRPADQRRECITIAIRATADDGAPTPVVPAGLWHIDIEPTDELEGPLEADLHVNRDDVGLFARGKGRQSYFDDPDDPRVDLVGDYRQGKLVGTRRAADSEQPRPGRRAFVRQEGTLNAYGFGEGTLLAAGYRGSDGEPAAYSASGAVGLPRRAKDRHGVPIDGPDLAAVTEESPALPGVLATGTYSGSVARLNGTSVAAPQVVRALADEIAEGGSVESLKARTGQMQGAAPGKQPANQPLRLGAGRLPFTPSHRGGD